MMTHDEWVQTGCNTAAEERALYDAGVITACEYEFGPHEDHSDCDRMLDEMQVGHAEAYDPSWDYPEYDPQTAFFEREGRPQFPNEY